MLKEPLLASESDSQTTYTTEYYTATPSPQLWQNGRPWPEEKSTGSMKSIVQVYRPLDNDHVTPTWGNSSPRAKALPLETTTTT